MAVPIDLLNNYDSSSDEDLSDSEISYSSEDESSESEITSARGTHITISSNLKFSAFTTLIKLARSLRNPPACPVLKAAVIESETSRSEEEEFWVRYPYLKNVMGTIVAQGLVSEYYLYERAKLIGDEKAKELNEKGKALFLMDLELCKEKCQLIAFAISAMKSGK